MQGSSRRYHESTVTVAALSEQELCGLGEDNKRAFVVHFKQVKQLGWGGVAENILALTAFHPCVRKHLASSKFPQ